MEKLGDEARFAYPYLPQDDRDASMPHTGGVVFGDERTEFFVSARKRHLEYRQGSTGLRARQARAQSRPGLNLLLQASGQLLHLWRGLAAQLST
jgi:hypothetical protein